MTKKEETKEGATENVKVPLESVEDRAQRLYVAFAAQKILEGGLALPPFGGLAPTDQRAWIAVAKEV